MLLKWPILVVSAIVEISIPSKKIIILTTGYISTLCWKLNELNLSANEPACPGRTAIAIGKVERRPVKSNSTIKYQFTLAINVGNSKEHLQKVEFDFLCNRSDKL